MSHSAVRRLPSDSVSQPESGTAVVCRGVTKSYGNGALVVRALRGLDLTVARGEFVVLMGPSGCGKTTLVSIISAVLDATEGGCEVLGRDLSSLSAAERERFRRDRIGFVFQGFNLLPALTLAENVAVPLLIAGRSRKDAIDKARPWLDAVGLGERTDAMPRQLSGGQQQRVAIARALVHDPGLIVCDEPTSSLDHDNGQSMMRLLRDTAEHQAKTVIVVTHDERVLPFADRIVRMEDGRVIDERTADHEKPTS